jgi:anti-anti-sigma regulatory factor
VLTQDNYLDWLAEVGAQQVGEPALSWLGAPMIVGDQVLGVITVQSYDTPYLYDEGNRDTLVAIANQASVALQNVKMIENLEQEVQERTAELCESLEKREQLQQEIIEAQKQTLRELSTPIIPVMERIIVMPLIGDIDSRRARDITRGLLAGIRQHRARVVILDITGVSIIDTGVANHLNKTIQAARLKGARTIVTGISDAVAETIVDLGIDWTGIDTVSDLQTGLLAAMDEIGLRTTG